MWRNQSYCTSEDSMLDKKTFRQLDDCWKPSYVGRCLPECDISASKYKYPLTAVRPDHVTISRETPKQMLPTAPELPYSKFTPPHWMESNDPQKYFKAGYTGNRFFTYPQFGHVSKVEAQSALCDFTSGYQYLKSAEFAPLPFYHAALVERAGNEIYPRDTGLIPNYKGHVPGMQHSYGKTFGNESVNAKRYLHDSSICLK